MEFICVQFNYFLNPLVADVSFGLSISGDPGEVSLSSATILNADWNKPFNNQITTGLDDT